MEKKIKNLPEILEVTGIEFSPLTNGNTTYKYSLNTLKTFINPENIVFFNCDINPLVVDKPGVYIFKDGTCNIEIHLTNSNFTVGKEVRFINYSDTYSVNILPYSGSSINNVDNIMLDEEYSTIKLLNIYDKFIIL